MEENTELMSNETEELDMVDTDIDTDAVEPSEGSSGSNGFVSGAVVGGIVVLTAMTVGKVAVKGIIKAGKWVGSKIKRKKDKEDDGKEDVIEAEFTEVDTDQPNPNESEK